MNGLYLLGADVADEVQTNVAAVSKRVSPWLWILSIGGFTMAVWNKVQIGKMYGNWKRARAALR